MPRGEGSVQKRRDDGFVGDVLLAFLNKIITDHHPCYSSHLKTLSKTPDDVFVIVQQGFEDLIVLDHVLVGENLREVVENVECPDVELVHGEDCWVAAYNEGETPEARDPVSNTDWQLSVEVLGAPDQLWSMILFTPIHLEHAGLHFL